MITENFLKNNDPKVDKTGEWFPVSEPYLSGNESKYVNDALVNNEISSQGKYVKLFAKEFARRVGCQYGVATSSGFTALYLALRALGVREGDEIICPTFTMIATPNAIRLCGAKPIFVDCKEDGNIDEKLIEEKITLKTKGIVPVHIYGKVCEMDFINDLARKYDLFVLEDAAEAHGACYKGRKAGSLGNAAAFSFYANKIVTSGEGGIITTNSQEIALTASNLRDYAFSRERHFWHKEFAINGRMSNLEGALGLAQTEKMKEYIESRRQWALGYQKLEELDIKVERYSKEDVCWMAGARIKNRDEFREKLAKVGIETRTWFIPCHLQPIYYNKDRYPISEKLSQIGLYLPTYSYYNKEKQQKIINLIKKIWRI